jgi:hypothetical protein
VAILQNECRLQGASWLGAISLTENGYDAQEGYSIMAVASVGLGMPTMALARGGGGGGHGGGGMGGGFRTGMAGGNRDGGFRGGGFHDHDGRSFRDRDFGHRFRFGFPYGYYDDYAYDDPYGSYPHVFSPYPFGNKFRTQKTFASQIRADQVQQT